MVGSGPQTRCDLTLQPGHWKYAIFCTMPATGTCTLLNMVTPLSHRHPYQGSVIQGGTQQGAAGNMAPPLPHTAVRRPAPRLVV